MKKSILKGFAVLLLLSTLAFSIPAELERPFEGELDLARLYSLSLKDMYPYMFSEKGKKEVYDGNSYGEFLGGFRGLALYTNLKSAVMEVGRFEHEDRIEHDNLIPFYHWSGLHVFKNGVSDMLSSWEVEKQKGFKFHHYNPKFIKWAAENMIPDAGTKIDGKTCEEIYQNTFSRFFRILALSRVQLEKKHKFKKEVKSYQKAMKEEDFEALSYLDKRYFKYVVGESVFSPYLSDEMNGAISAGGFLSHSTFTPSLAIGFWCRRSIDGSEVQCWEALCVFMQEFDNEWFSEHVPKKMRKNVTN